MDSIRARLLISSMVAVVLGGLALISVSYFFTLREINLSIDESLKQVAIAMASYGRAGAAEHRDRIAPWPLPAEPRDEYDIVTTAWNAAGELTYSSDPQVHLPLLRKTGASVVSTAEGEWHVFVIANDDGVVQAAHREASRRFMAAEAASSLLVPLLGLLALTATALGVALRQSLVPLNAASNQVAVRNPSALEPLDLSRQPREIRPLIHAMNQLMGRLATAFEARQRFISDAAHGLRTPIAALRLQLHLLERAKDPVANQHALLQCKAGAARAQRLTNQLLDLSNIDREPGAPELERIDLSRLAESVVSASVAIADGSAIDLGLDASAPAWVQGDRVQIGLLLSNLLENALRYTPKGGVVDVVVRSDAGRVCLDVIDNGPGIPPGEQGKVFDRFFRGSAAAAADTSGSGLGLAIVKAVADRHGASVTLSPAPAGQGLQVRVSFVHDAVNAAPIAS